MTVSNGCWHRWFYPMGGGFFAVGRMKEELECGKTRGNDELEFFNEM